MTTFFSADGHIQDFIIQRWDIQYFTLESLVAMDDVTVNNAKLHIHVPHKGSSDKTSTRRPRNITLDNEEEVWVDLYYVKVDNQRQIARLVQTDAARVRVFTEQSRWIAIDMMEILVGVWLKFPSENFGIHIKVQTKSGTVLPVGVQHQLVNVSNKQGCHVL